MADSFLAKPHRTAGANIRCPYLQDAGIIVIGFIVKGEQLLGQILKNKIKAKDTALFYPILQAKVALISDVVFDNFAGAQGLVDM